MRKLVLVLFALLMVGAGGAGVWFWNWTVEAPRRALRAFEHSLKADYRAEVAYLLSAGEVSDQATLAVAALETTVTGQYASEKEMLGIDLGTTALTYTVPVRYYYAVDLSGERPVDFSIDEATQTLTVTFSDLEVLSAEADVGKLRKQIDVGWGRLRKYSGGEVQERFEKQALADLRERGMHPPLVALVRERARLRLTDLVHTFLAERIADERAVADVVVRFRGEEPKNLDVRLETTPAD